MVSRAMCYKISQAHKEIFMNGQLESRPYTTWQLIKAFWQSDQRLMAYGFFITVLIMTMVMVALDVALTDWYNYFYNALQEYDVRAVIDLLWIFVFIATLSIVISVYRFYLQQYLGLRWRRWLTEQFIKRWLANRSYYYLETFDKQTDNPDQRIQEDIGSLVSYSLDLVIGLVSAVTSIFSFIFILWQLSGVITLPLGELGTWHIPGYLVWVGIIYAVLGTLFTVKIGRSLVPLNFEQQRREANFRYAAVDLRLHAENVALYHGEGHQGSVLKGMLYRVLDNWYLIILRQKLLLWYTSGYNQISVLVPLVVALPNYFNKVFELGGLIQTLAAFQRIQDSLSFIVNSYTRIAEWQAITQRLVTFLNHMYQLEQEAMKQNQFAYSMQPQDKIIAKNVTLFTPQKETLLTNINQEFIHGQNYLLKGISGIGKSTFVRALAGIWPFGSGEIDLPEQKNIMFLPQRSYMPIGTLQEALMFPNNMSLLPDQELKKLLNECGLHNLIDQLHETKTWSENLSPGELQRIAFARILIHKPDWVFLDETTSSLDVESEKKLYDLLKTKLPNCSIISVGHRPSLAGYHDREINMAEYKI